MFVNVGEECVGRPAAEFLDGVSVVAMEFESHGTASSKRMTADTTKMEALGDKPQGRDCVFDRVVDVRGNDVCFDASGCEVS